MNKNPGKNDPEGPDAFKWKRVEGQILWVKIGIAFLIFYAGEAVLFWQGLALAAPLMRMPLFNPIVYPLGYWSLFAYVIYLIQRKNPSSISQPAAVRRFHRWQGGLLTLGITIGVVGAAFVIMKGSGSTTLGHVALFFAMFQAAVVIGAMELNVGWLTAAGLWFLTALVINFYPSTMDLIPYIKDEDLWIGLATALGFFLIGLFPQCVDREPVVERIDGNNNITS
jgi:hypothetical protein